MSKSSRWFFLAFVALFAAGAMAWDPRFVVRIGWTNACLLMGLALLICVLCFHFALYSYVAIPSNAFDIPEKSLTEEPVHPVLVSTISAGSNIVDLDFFRRRRSLSKR